MLTIGDRFPEYELKGVVSENLDKAFETFRHDSHKGRWRVVFFYPKDFTFVCPTEIVGYAKLAKQFADRDAVVLGASTDSEFVHLAWRQHNADLKGLAIPLLADTAKSLSTALGILMGPDKVSMRATFVVDPEGIIRHVTVNDGKVGRNPEEALRVLDALQTDELCPCNWKPGQDTIHPR
jgi:peroxiredoxin (alkyl hydroperoxide reductase subunit C)